MARVSIQSNTSYITIVVYIRTLKRFSVAITCMQHGMIIINHYLLFVLLVFVCNLGIYYYFRIYCLEKDFCRPINRFQNYQLAVLRV